MEPRRSDTQLQVTKGFHLEKNQPRTGQGVKEARGSWDVTWRLGLFGRSADLTKVWKGILSTWFIQQNCWIGWDDKNTRNLSWPELTYGIQEEQRRFNLIGKVKKNNMNRLKYKHTANSSIMRPKTKHAIQIRYQNYLCIFWHLVLFSLFRSVHWYYPKCLSRKINENQLIISPKLAIFPNANEILKWLNLLWPDVTTTTFQERFLCTP